MRRVAILILAVIATLFPLRADETPEAVEVEAAFLYRFLFFVKDQPENQPDGTLCLGVLGSDPYGALLEEVDGRSVRGARVRVRHFDSPGEIDACELVFVSPDVAGGVEAAVRALSRRRILTVSTAEGFARRGGIIELRLHDERVRFDLSISAARRDGIHLSSELLEVARRIYR